MQHEEYAAIDAVNWSTLVHLATSPMMLRWRADHPREDTRALRLGRAIHCAVLEPERWEREYVARPDFGDLRTKAAKQARAEWLVDLPAGVEVLEPEEYELAERCGRAVREHPVAASLLRGGRAEEVVTWTDEETGLACKARLDFITPAYVLDLKSTRQTTLRAIWRDFASRLYHGQVAFYQEGAIATQRIPHDAEPPRIIAVQTVEPFDVIAARMTREDLERGTGLFRSLLRQYADCQAVDLWPGLAPNLVEVDLPAWAPGGEMQPEEEW